MITSTNCSTVLVNYPFPNDTVLVVKMADIGFMAKDNGKKVTLVQHLIAFNVCDITPMVSF